MLKKIDVSNIAVFISFNRLCEGHLLREKKMSYEEILYTASEGIAIITLNRPDRLNVWTRVMAGEVWYSMHRAADDDATKVIVLTGAGRGFFVAPMWPS
jgi:1,4-dihydroxy-2-naphthoyl-CoA synthase